MSKNWSEIKTGVGFATHIPENLNLLASSNEETRYNAYWKIDNYAIIQGDLYEAAYYIIDPLMNALKDAKYKNRNSGFINRNCIRLCSRNGINRNQR